MSAIKPKVSIYRNDAGKFAYGLKLPSWPSTLYLGRVDEPETCRQRALFFIRREPMILHTANVGSLPDSLRAC